MNITHGYARLSATTILFSPWGNTSFPEERAECWVFIVRFSITSEYLNVATNPFPGTSYLPFSAEFWKFWEAPTYG